MLEEVFLELSLSDFLITDWRDFGSGAGTRIVVDRSAPRARLDSSPFGWYKLVAVDLD
jgi:hypothetical protein